MTPLETTLAQVQEFFKIDPQVMAQATTHQWIDIPNTDRETLSQFFAFMGSKQGVEIGVEQGGYAEILCKHNPDCDVIGVDAWAPYKGYRDHVTLEKLERFLAATKERLAPYKWRPIRAFSVDAAAQFKDRSLDWVYIDGNHNFINVAKDLDAWIPKVRKGGIISGHDFVRKPKRFYQCHVVEVVTGYTAAYHIKPWFVLGSKNVVEGQKRDKPRSFFWVNE